MLHQQHPPDTLRLIDRAGWRPHPPIADRAAWDGLPASVRAAYLAAGEALQRLDWPLLPATRYLIYARDGNRSRYEEIYFRRRGKLEALVIAECIENKGRFLDDIADGIWLLCEESSWCLPAHVYMQRGGIGLPDTTEPIVDLFAAETSALLAWADYFLGDRLDSVSPQIRLRLRREIDQRILTPCLARDDFWWTGFTEHRVNNWNPWVNSNWLASVLLIEPDAARRKQAVAKAMRSLDRFIDTYPQDGGCDEGPGYWVRAGASLFDCLELLHSATGGQVDVYAEPLIQNIGRFISRVQIAGAYFVNFADASAIVEPPAGLVFRYGRRTGDPDLMRLGAWAAARNDLLHNAEIDWHGFLASLGRLVPSLFSLQDMAAHDATPPLPRDVWLPNVQVMCARDMEGSSDGLYVAAKGGHNAESHNHNDVGNFIVYADGRPVIVDAGVETYTRKTFSPQRYEIWTMQSAYHNLLPTIDGAQQAPGEQFAARDVAWHMDDATVTFSLDLAGAYPAEAKLKRWQRVVTLRRGREVEIADHYELSGAANEIVLGLLVASEAEVVSPGEIVLRPRALADGRESGAARLFYDAGRFKVAAESIAITDGSLTPVWGSQLTRLVFTAREVGLAGEWRFSVQPW